MRRGTTLTISIRQLPEWKKQKMKSLYLLNYSVEVVAKRLSITQKLVSEVFTTFHSTPEEYRLANEYTYETLSEPEKIIFNNTK